MQLLNKKFFEVTKRLERDGFFEYSVSHVMYRQLELFSFMGFGVWAVIKSAGSLTSRWWWIGAISLGVFMGRSGWLQHEFNHGSTSKVVWLNHVLGSFWWGFGEAGSASWWRREHNRHHADPQRHGADLDMETAPIAFDSETAKSSKIPFILKHQVWIYQIGFWLHTSLLIFYIHPRYILRTRSYTDLLFISLHWVSWLLCFIPTLGFTSAMVLHFVATMVGSSMLFTNFALSHTTMPFLPTDKREHWVERALRRTIDIHSHARFVGNAFVGFVFDKCVDWWMGYLNYQVIHHLWPLMPQHLQSRTEVHDAVKELAACVPELRLEYNVTSYWTAVYDMHANLSVIGEEYGDWRKHKEDGVVRPVAPSWVKGVPPTKI